MNFEVGDKVYDADIKIYGVIKELKQDFNASNDLKTLAGIEFEGYKNTIVWVPVTDLQKVKKPVPHGWLEYRR